MRGARVGFWWCMGVGIGLMLWRGVGIGWRGVGLRIRGFGSWMGGIIIVSARKGLVGREVLTLRSAC